MPNIHRIKMINLTLLYPHPLHTSALPPALHKKLQSQISSTGRYEPLIVRPHPTIPHAFQLIHGHQRLAALQALGHRRAACLVWHLNDLQTLSLLANVNRLRGKEKAATRLALLRRLHSTVNGNLDRLAALLPESPIALQMLFAPSRVALPHPALPADRPQPLTLFLPAAQRARLSAALKNLHPDPATALLAALQVLSGNTPPASVKINPLQKVAS